jgi:Methyltransferase domain
MISPFFTSYAASFESISGMFSLDAALLMTAYNQLACQAGVTGDSLEIGVHHGLSAILVACLRSPGRRFVAIDLFEMQQGNVSHSGSGNKEIFLSNMRKFYPDLGFMSVLSTPSSSASPRDLGTDYSFCHIDGGHSAQETYADLALCSEITLASGLVLLDDYFNTNFPGVCEGAIQFNIRNPDVLIPLAVGFNKVVFQRSSSGNLNHLFGAVFDFVPRTQILMWDRPAFLFGSSITPYFDLTRSTPTDLAGSTAVRIAATFALGLSVLSGRPDAIVHLPVTVANTSSIPFSFGGSPIGLSYHLLSHEGKTIAYDRPRTYFFEPLYPDNTRTVHLPIVCPLEKGQYKVEVDLVWEGMCWFKDRGNSTPVLPLIVS